MAKRRNERKHSFTERLSDKNIMSDGMLEPINQMDMAILPVAMKAPTDEKKRGKKDQNR
ncbi:hypothetical protein [Alkaliphilus serpentinus]|uniref:hypothetical protein n=1 Tax=Alkaliphilus serpentinus TaxID=1482731 RepID=UPI0018657B55|nr:hypothetical protein [Alkaliphilus serpentinus]